MALLGFLGQKLSIFIRKGVIKCVCKAKVSKSSFGMRSPNANASQHERMSLWLNLHCNLYTPTERRKCSYGEKICRKARQREKYGYEAKSNHVHVHAFFLRLGSV